MPDNHNLPNMWVHLTKSGLRIDLLGVLHTLVHLQEAGEYEEVGDYLTTLCVLLAKACEGDERWLNENYENAMVTLFQHELDMEDPIEVLRQDSGKRDKGNASE